MGIGADTAPVPFCCYRSDISCDADPAVDAPELIYHSPGNHDSVVFDAALSHREHVVDRQEPVDVDAHPVRVRRFPTDRPAHRVDHGGNRLRSYRFTKDSVAV